MSTSVRDT
jgi:hypothetical protein